MQEREIGGVVTVQLAVASIPFAMASFHRQNSPPIHRGELWQCPTTMLSGKTPLSLQKTPQFWLPNAQIGSQSLSKCLLT